MKAYGHSRRDKLSCQYGCCTGKCGKERNSRDIVDKARRKKERNKAKKEIKENDT
jgi:hypothetical protein